MSQEWLDIEALDIKEVAIDYYKRTHNEDRPGVTFTHAKIGRASCRERVLAGV